MVANNDLISTRRYALESWPTSIGPNRMVAINPVGQTSLRNLFVYFDGPANGIEVLRMENDIFNPDVAWADGYYNDSGVLTSSSTTTHSVNGVPIDPSTDYVEVGVLKTVSTYSAGQGLYFWNSSNGWLGRKVVITARGETYTRMPFTTPAACDHITYQAPAVSYRSTYGYDINQIAICKESDVTTLNISWQSIGNLYNGYVDLVTGKLVGATTNGGAVGTYQLTPLDIPALTVKTNFWCDTAKYIEVFY